VQSLEAVLVARGRRVCVCVCVCVINIYIHLYIYNDAGAQPICTLGVYLSYAL
jgi:hypothetical protein